MIEDQIKNLYEALLENWNKQNAEAYAELFTLEGSVIGFDGSQINGQLQIEQELSKIFSEHKVAIYVNKIREIRKLSSSVYLLRAVAGMVPEGQSAINPAVNAIQTLVAQKENNEFRIAVFQNTPAAFHGRPELSSKLTGELQEVLNTRFRMPGSLIND